LFVFLQANTHFFQNLVCLTYDSYNLFSSMLLQYNSNHPQHASISGLKFISLKSLNHSCHWVSETIIRFCMYVQNLRKWSCMVQCMHWAGMTHSCI